MNPPNPLAGLKWMTFQAGRIQGKAYRKMVMVNMVSLVSMVG